MLADSEQPAPPPAPRWTLDWRLLAGILLLAVAAFFTWSTIEGLSQRRDLRMQLAEISHARYGVLNANRWVEIVVPILDAKVDALDLNPDKAAVKPTVEAALNRLLDQVKEKMSAPPAKGAAGGGLLGGANAMMANMMVGALRPHIPEYADTVLAEFSRPDNQQALKKYMKKVLADGVKGTFGNVDMRWYAYILKQNGCTDGGSCQQKLGDRIREDDQRIQDYYLTVLAAAAVTFALLMIKRPILGRPAIVVLLLFCIVLLAGGILTPMIEVEAKISHLGLSLLGTKIAFDDQVLYFQSKSVLEVFRTLIGMGRPDMWIVGVLVLMFSVVFPTLKICTLALCLFWPTLLERSRLAKFLALESSKWSMADVMALAIFMSFVAFNGIISNTMSGLLQTGAELAIPTESSKILPGYHIFIAFVLASLFLSKKLEHGIRTRPR